MKRNGVHNARVVGVKGQNIGYAVIHELLQSKRAVEGFPSGSLVLAAFVQERHHDADSVCLSVCRGDDALEVLEMVIGAHVVDVSELAVGDAVIAYINEDEKVNAPYGLIDDTLALAASETGKVHVDDVIVCGISIGVLLCGVLGRDLLPELDQILVDGLSHFFASGQSDQLERSDCRCIHQIFCISHESLRYNVFSQRDARKFA